MDILSGWQKLNTINLSFILIFACIYIYIFSRSPHTKLASQIKPSFYTSINQPHTLYIHDPLLSPRSNTTNPTILIYGRLLIIVIYIITYIGFTPNPNMPFPLYAFFTIWTFCSSFFFYSLISPLALSFCSQKIFHQQTWSAPAFNEYGSQPEYIYIFLCITSLSFPLPKMLWVFQILTNDVTYRRNFGLLDNHLSPSEPCCKATHVGAIGDDDACRE